MGYRSLRQCVDDLAANGHLLVIEEPVHAQLQAAEIHRRVYQSGGPALLFNNVVGCSFPMVSNLFGTLQRAHFIFRDTLESVRRLVELKTDNRPRGSSWRRYWRAPWHALRMRPRLRRSGPILARETMIGRLPQQTSWPEDGGAFVTLPEVYTEHADKPGLGHSNLGMYRVQLSGGQYEADSEVGLHYQIHRGIGVHHEAAIRHQQPLEANVFVGGSPAMMLAAVMPLPEGISELGFAGVLEGRRIGMVRQADHLPIYEQADFCISGTVDPERVLPEGPFGDHLGYYSLVHPFPVLTVRRVFHREDAIWPFTVVGRPPQEDSVIGQLIHDLTGPAIPSVIPGVKAVQAVDAAGVHPLLLAIGSERYVPYEQSPRPEELLTQAHAILGQGQLSLAKYLLIVNGTDDPELDVNDTARFFRHLLERVDWQRDLHFQTCTTIDTLDYSGDALNQGSKLVIAARGPARRRLATELPPDLSLPDGFHEPTICLPGVLVVSGPPWQERAEETTLRALCQHWRGPSWCEDLPLAVVVDDATMVSQSLENLLWVTFTRSNPAADIDGVDARVDNKHWGCRGSLVIDARSKTHHAPSLEVDPETLSQVDAMAAGPGPLAQYL